MSDFPGFNNHWSTTGTSGSLYPMVSDNNTGGSGDKPPSSLFAEILNSRKKLIELHANVAQNKPEILASNPHGETLRSSENTESHQLTKTMDKFVKSLIGPASEAAVHIGTSAAAIVAIAALETGWGKFPIRSPAGQNSHNLFGIKSIQPDALDAVRIRTTEYLAGKPTPVTDYFRSYPSERHSILDFAKFVTENARYKKAIEHAANPSRFIEELHKAGYATDPEYSAKVKSILRTIENSLQQDAMHWHGSRPLLPLADS